MGGPGSGRRKGSAGKKKYVDPRIVAQKKANRAQEKLVRQMKNGTLKSAYERKNKRGF